MLFCINNCGAAMKKPSIHNNFFSDLFSDERNVRDFLSAKLPVDVRDNLKLSKIVIDSENYTPVLS